MNSSTDQIISNSLSLRLKQETAAEHERMHQLMSQSLAAGLMIWTIPHPWFVYPAILCMAGVLVWMWLKK